MEIMAQINGGHWKWWGDEYKRLLFCFERQLAYNTDITFYWEYIFRDKVYKNNDTNYWESRI